MNARGYFGIGVEGISKPMNFGNLSRTAYGFGASFVFTVAPGRYIDAPPSDTTRSQDHMPWYTFKGCDDLRLPDDCRLVGVELLDEAIDLPSFRHPTRAAYILGPEGGSLSPEMTAKCEFIIKIPTRFCLNVATAGAVIMYDRMLSLGKFAERPVKVGAPASPAPQHIDGKAKYSGGKRIPPKKGRNRLGPANKS
ncbi:RNA methyltransferase [Pseudahrensia aquimaris]|uniref:RNA methyltransferase n=1 Tax=Pseudahrensia aquimaris TaxID=744461 RepID=A0ABW3FG66_9HYPH